MVGKLALVRAVGRPADQHEAPVAIAAIDIAMLVDLEEHTRMAERGAAGNIGRSIAGDAGVGDSDEFGRGQHELRDSKRRSVLQSLSAALPSRRRVSNVAT